MSESEKQAKALKRTEYKLVRGSHHYIDDSGEPVHAKPGDKIPLTKGQAKAFANKISPIGESVSQPETVPDPVPEPKAEEKSSAVSHGE